MIPQVQECRIYSTLDCHFLCSLSFFSLQRMRDITRTQLCTKEVSGHNLNLKSLSSVLSTACFFCLERRIVVFCNPIFRWLNFLNVPKPTDSPLLCTAGRQRMTWFSSSHRYYRHHIYQHLVVLSSSIVTAP